MAWIGVDPPTPAAPAPSPGWKSTPRGRLQSGSAFLFSCTVTPLFGSSALTAELYYMCCTHDETHLSVFLLPCTFSLRGESCTQATLLTLTLSSLNQLCVCVVRLALRIQKLKANIRKQIFTEATPPFFFVNSAATGNVSAPAGGGEEKATAASPSFYFLIDSWKLS